MSAGYRKFASNDQDGISTDKFYFSGGTAGSLTGAVEFVHVVPEGSWEVTNVILSAGTNTTHSTSGLITLQVSDNDGGNAVLSTAATLADTAGTGAKNTAAAGTGITQAVVDTDEDDFTEGDLLFVDLSEAGSGGADPADVGYLIELTKIQDFDPAP